MIRTQRFRKWSYILDQKYIGQLKAGGCQLMHTKTIDSEHNMLLRSPLTLIVLCLFYSSVHINESKAIWGKNFVDFLGKYLSSRETQYQFSHPHFKSFHMNLSDFYSDQLISWHKTKHDFEPFIWPIRKNVCCWEILNFFFHQISSFRQLLWFIWRHFNISSKNGRQSMESF